MFWYNLSSSNREIFRPRLRSYFHNLLVYLSVFDFIYLLASQAMFGFPTISLWYKYSIYPKILPIVSGIGHTSRVGSVYLTLSITIERYFAIVHPLRHIGWKHTLAPLSIIFAVVYNVPRFFEFYYDSKRDFIIVTALRSNNTYITYYIFWSKFILIELIPYFLIIVLNSLIICKVYRSTQFRKISSFRGGNQAGQHKGNSTHSKKPEEEDCFDLEGQNIVAQDSIPLATFVASDKHQFHRCGESCIV